MSELPIQRRLQRRLVQTQARVEAGMGDRWIPLLVMVGLILSLAWTGMVNVRSMESGVDLAGYTQAIWQIGEGTTPRASLLGDGVHMLELGWSFVLYPLALIGRFVSPSTVLVGSQALALGVVVVPLWLLARRVNHLRVSAATALIMAYALHPATHRLGTEDFHPESLAVPALVGMAYFGTSKKWVPYWLCVAFALLTRADLGLVVALWGLVVLGSRSRNNGLWTLAVGLFWSLGLLLVVQPIVGQGALFGNGAGTGMGFGGVVFSALRTPGELFAQENMTLIVSLLAPVIFLPLLSLRHFAPALPLAGLYLIAGGDGAVAFAERAAMLLAFVMIAAAFALNRLGSRGVDTVFLDRRILTTLVAASVLVYVSTSPISLYERPWQGTRLDATDEAIQEAVAQLPPDVTVRASPSALVHLAERNWLFAVEPDRELLAAQAGFPEFTWAVLVVERELPERSATEREEFDRGMAAQGFEILMDKDGVALYSRAELPSPEQERAS